VIRILAPCGEAAEPPKNAFPGAPGGLASPYSLAFSYPVLVPLRVGMASPSPPVPEFSAASTPTTTGNSERRLFFRSAMKTKTMILLGCLLATSAHAEFRTWTRADGKTAEFELVSVSGEAGAKSGVFKMHNGRSVTLKASVFSDDDAKLLEEWKPAEATATAGAALPSVFDKLFDKNLLKLSGKSLQSCKDATKPRKYYLFYYTASWCGPCHKFTPSLVEFYNKNKDDSFELVLISSDRDEKAMTAYAAEMTMPWPQLRLSKVRQFKRDFKYPGGGIPNLVLTDLEGNLIKGSYEGQKYVGPHVVMQHLESLLKQ